jgi:hypothetical protein
MTVSILHNVSEMRRKLCVAACGPSGPRAVRVPGGAMPQKPPGIPPRAPPASLFFAQFHLRHQSCILESVAPHIPLMPSRRAGFRGAAAWPLAAPQQPALPVIGLRARPGLPS